MPPTECNRRTLLQAVASTGLLTVAGCSSSDDASTSTSPSNDDTTATAVTDAMTDDSTPDESTGEPDVAALTQKATAVVTDWSNGDYEAMREPFTQRMREAVTTEEFEEIWSELTATKGPFVSISDTRYTTSQGYDVIVVTARFAEGQQQFTVTFDDQQRVAGLRAVPSTGSYSPPQYADKSAFTEQDRTIQATESCSLGATLTLPEGDESVPGVVLVHGSGPHDRDETIGPNKVFRDLAWGLASNGVAVLRYDKRTSACEVSPTEATMDRVITEDALAAVDVLRAEERVADGDVVVAGHSLGAMVAPRIAARDGNLAGIAMLAAPARSLPALLDDQNEYVANLDGTVTEAEQSFLDEIHAKTDRIRNLDIGPNETLFGKGRAWWQSLQEYDQIATAKDLSLPMYVLQGNRDYQVDPEEDYGRWQEALDGQSNVSFEQYDALDHLFMSGEGKSRPEDYFEPNSVAERVVTDLATWTQDIVPE